jgi:adenylate cyclase
VAGERVERRLAAVLAADVAGYSRLMGADEVGTLSALKAVRREIVDPAIALHMGRIVKTTGDGMLVEFASAVDAVSCAIEVQGKMAEQAESAPQKIAFRIGINIGDLIIEGNDIFGDGVNVAARVENECEPGGVCLSGTAFEQVRGKTDFVFDDLGEKSLKNIERPVRLYAARPAGEKAKATPLSGIKKPPPLPDKPSIAVLPFQNMSGDPEQEYFADGMVEEIITALSRNKQLFVIARNSSFTFKGKPVEIKQVARDLGVRYVLEGSVRKSGNHVRITGQLIDAASGAHLWADRYDGSLENVFDLQDNIATSVVGAINPSVIHAEMERAKRKPTTSLDAYDNYLRGLAAGLEYSRESWDRAAGFYEQAIALDPQYASPRAMLATLLVSRKDWGWSIDQEAENSRASALAETALSLQQADPWVLSNCAWVVAKSSREVELANSLIHEAIRLDPNGMNAWLWGGAVKMFLGDHLTAIDYVQRAMRLSPLDPRIFMAQNTFAFANFFLGNYEVGLKFAMEALRFHPNFLSALRLAMACSAMRGDVKAAQEFWRRIAMLHPNDRVSDVRKRFPYQEEDYRKLEEALRMVGMPE